MASSPSIVLACGLSVGLNLGLLACATSTSPEPGVPIAIDPHASVEWADWSAESFARAASEDRLILINVVATWCHWCHVMEEVTYADPEVASLLAAHFVVIRVDSDARPDVSERYRAWGWPATAILSPTADPVVNLRGFRKPEVFAALLRELIEEQRVGQLRRREPGVERDTKRAPADADLDRIRAKATAQLDAYFDVDGLGWGDTQKYPKAEPIDYGLLRARLWPDRDSELIWRERALLTLDAERGLIDPVWGGMYQYSLAGVWDQPHFEKIAKVQAGALDNYAHATMITGERRWLDPAGDLSRYLLETMQDPAGGFYTSQDADLRRADGTSVAGKDYYALDDAERRELGIPRIDTAIYADLNGLTIHGLTELYRATGDAALLDAAERAATRVLASHRAAAGGLTHGSDARPDALRHLADQAAMCWGLLGLYRVTAERRWLDEARTLATFMVETLADDDGGLFAHTQDPAAVGVFAERRKPLRENALAAQTFIELHRFLDGDGSVETPWLDHARRTLLAVGGDAQLEASGKSVGRYLYALALLQAPSFDLTVVAHDGDPSGDALWRAALAIWEPRASIERSVPGQRYADLGYAAVYLCSDRACSMPLREPATLAEQAEAFLRDY